MIIDARTKDILSTMEIDGFKTVITETLTRPEYVRVNEVLETLGGKWSRKDKAHVWTCSPSEALKVVLGTDSTTITTTLETKKEAKKKFQVFHTPPELANKVVYMATIEETDTVLEPSAGTGNLVLAVNVVLPNKHVDCYEILEANRIELAKIPTVNLLGNDFLEAVPEKKYDRIVMNPPFKSHADITHIKHAYKFLADKGRLISICSCHPFHASHKIDVAFREWLDSIGAVVDDIEAGAFSESGTEIPTKIITVDK